MSTASRATRLHLVVPCYNEARRLDIDAFSEFTRAHGNTTLLFVDDGSTDATPRVLAGLAAANAGRVDVLTMPRNGGKASAVHAGILAGLRRPADYVGYWDADLSTPLSAVHQFLAVADSHPDLDVVIGSRVKLLGRRIQRHAWRHYIGRVFATGASVALGLPVYDTQCGAKLFRVSDLTRRVFEEPFRSAWVFDVEILARYVAILGLDEAASRIFELPLAAWTDVPGSSVRSWHGVQAVCDLIRIGLARRAGRMP
jgi:dolichyl-phosphate beta-glucosyltransferase